MGHTIVENAQKDILNVRYAKYVKKLLSSIMIACWETFVASYVQSLTDSDPSGLWSRSPNHSHQKYTRPEVYHPQEKGGILRITQLYLYAGGPLCSMLCLNIIQGRDFEICDL